MSTQTDTTNASSGSPKACCAWRLAAALLFLRLCVGWHFFSEGLEKVSYDRSTGQWQLDFSAAGFLTQAKGPLAGLFLNRVPGGHRWQATLAVPEELTPASGDRLAAWVADYAKRRPAESTQIEVPDFVPYAAWFAQIESDRRVLHERFTKVAGLTDEQRAAAAAIFERRQRQLADYLAGEAPQMQAYQHELRRLEHLEQSPGADEVPFLEQRVVQKQAETSRTPLKWVAAVDGFDDQFAKQLHRLLTEEQLASSVGRQADAALADPKEIRLHWLNLAIAGVTLGVGGCLLLGLFTRLASVVGALFLLSIMATQPPWVPGSVTTYFHYQLVELAALVLLAAAAAGRVAGLDFFLHRLFSRGRGTEGAAR